MVKISTKLLDSKKSPKKTPEEKIKEIGDALHITPRKPKESLTEMEREFLSKMFTAFLKQYPLVSKGKYPNKYVHTHKMGMSLKKKMIRMKMIEEII